MDWNPRFVPFSPYDLRRDIQSPSASIYGNVNSNYFIGCGYNELTHDVCLKECLECHKYYLLFSLIIVAIIIFFHADSGCALSYVCVRVCVLHKARVCHIL